MITRFDMWCETTYKSTLSTNTAYQMIRQLRTSVNYT